MVASIRIIGSLNVDMVTVTPRFPGPGETLTATSFNILAGGKGANQAVACGRQSRKLPKDNEEPAKSDVNVEMIGAVGGKDGQYTTILEPVLSRSGVSSSNVKVVENDHTGVAVITVDSSAGGENRILFSPGANYSGMQPTPEVLSRCLAEPMPDILVMQCEIPTETVIAILRGVNAMKRDGKCATQVVFNPAPAPEDGLPADAWGAVDHLVLNETEAELMAPKDIPAEVGEVGGQGRREEIAKYYHGLGVRTVIVTLGSAGLWYSAADPYDASTTTPGADWLRVMAFVPAKKVEKVVDTTAAGDTFVGAYSVRMAEFNNKTIGRVQDMSVEERKVLYSKVTQDAASWAAAASAVCVQRAGAMDSIPFMDEVNL
ncbi:ribokinase [Ascosphaera apis ARSEF 7405]|uniref:Ribokinase n=1 Tax=Ascosphaera apis ARSEF 7405 TaxID=392613 RepID=A0A167X9T5_9EURO|nr:ribokinase [Ascosphaera apis ARSEF 7405]